MEILNQANLPFGTGVWNVIASEISEYLSKRLTVRSAVDFKGGLGFETDAITSQDIDSEIDFIVCEAIFNSKLYKNFIKSS